MGGVPTRTQMGTLLTSQACLTKCDFQGNVTFPTQSQQSQMPLILLEGLQLHLAAVPLTIS